EAERCQMLTEWNDTSAAYRDDKCIHQLLAEQAVRSPEAIAVVHADLQLTYEVLNERSNQLARHLMSKGVGPEVLVAACLDRSAEIVVALLGVLKAGGAYVPLDPGYPVTRLPYMLGDAGVTVLITEGRLEKSMPAFAGEIVLLDSHQQTILEEDTLTVERRVTAENLAYVIYTSGSTGKPKGVPISHRCVVNFLESMARKLSLDHRDVLAAVTTLSFDIAGLELYLPLATGGRTVIIGREEALDGSVLAEKVSEIAGTVMQATPSTWRMITESGWNGKDDLRILCGGESLSSDLAEKLMTRGSSVWNLCGPTETTIWSLSHQVNEQIG